MDLTFFMLVGLLCFGLNNSVPGTSNNAGLVKRHSPGKGQSLVLLDGCWSGANNPLPENLLNTKTDNIIATMRKIH